jgi:hypothetical protein
MENKLREFGNYLISVYDNSKEEYYYNIKGSLIDVPDYLIPQVLKSFREEDEAENQIIIENEVEVVKKSQLKEFEFVYGIDVNNEEVKNKVLEYLNELLQYKNSL